MNVLDKITFEDRAFTVIDHDGRKAVVARELGDALGYSRTGRRLCNYITGKWSNELTHGRDYLVLGSDGIRALRYQGAPPDLVSAKARNLTILFESGVHLCLLKSNRPAGVALRRFLADTLFPAIANGDVFTSKTVPDGTRIALAKVERDVEIARIGAKVEMARIAQLAQEMHAEAALLEAKASLLDAQRLKDGAGGDPIPPELVQPADYLRSSQIADVLGYRLKDDGTHYTYQVTKALKGLAAHGIQGLATSVSRRCVTVKPEGGRYPGFCYHRSLVPKIRAWLMTNDLLPAQIAAKSAKKSAN
jgi:prophage antirepressor-like protein